MSSFLNPVLVIVGITIFRDKPQNLPATNAAVGISVVCSFLVKMWMDNALTAEAAWEFAILQIVMFGAITAAVLVFANRLSRWRQTLTALYGSSAVLQLVTYSALNWALSSYQENPESFWLFAVIMASAVWTVSVTAFIFREALETTNLKAFFIGLGVLFSVSIAVLMIFSIFGNPMPTVLPQ